MTIYTAVITLILVMDPLGNIPIFLSVLNTVEETKRTKVLLRESFIAFILLVAFLFAGQHIMHSLNITESALLISGGIILFLIALKMIFPPNGENQREKQIGEPFIVPLAIPLLAGPSAIATVLLFATQHPDQMWHWFIAIALASGLTTLILVFASSLRNVLGQKGLVAVERLMGMLLTTVAIQMFLRGLDTYFKLPPS